MRNSSTRLFEHRPRTGYLIHAGFYEYDPNDGDNGPLRIYSFHTVCRKIAGYSFLCSPGVVPGERAEEIASRQKIYDPERLSGEACKDCYRRVTTV